MHRVAWYSIQLHHLASSFPKLCSNRTMVAMATKIYDLVIKSGLPLTTKIQTSLLAMYGRCGDASKSRMIFQQIQEHDCYSLSAMMSVYMRNNLLDEGIEFFQKQILPNIHIAKPDNYFWNSLISGCMANNAPEKAVELFKIIKCVGVRLDPEINADVIQACSLTKQFQLAKQTHEEIIQSGTPVSTRTQNSLINVYCKSGETKRAEEIFLALRKQNKDDIASWNTILSSLIQNGHYNEAIKHFTELQTTRIQPTLITFTLVLVAVINTRDLSLGKEIHGKIHNLLPSSALLRNRLMEMYATCGDLPMAQSLFQKMHQAKLLDSYSWNTIIKALSRHNEGQQAIDCYHSMRKEGFTPDETTFSLILPWVSSLDVGMEIHRQILQVRGDSLSVKNCLIEMYGRCGDIDRALSIFNSLQTQADQYSWNILLNAFYFHQMFDKVRNYFELMQRAGISPSEITYGIIIGAILILQDTNWARTILPQLLQTVPLPVIPLHSLMTLLDKEGDNSSVQSVFQALKVTKQADIYSYNILLNSFNNSGNYEAVLECFLSMQTEGAIQPSEVTLGILLSVASATGNLELGKQIHQQITHHCVDLPPFLHNKLIEMYGKCGQLETAQKLFHQMHQIKKVDEFSWNIMLTILSLHGRYAEAIDCFESMIQEGVQPTEATFTIILGVVTVLGDLSFGIKVHTMIFDRNICSTPVFNQLITMYAKCDQVTTAQEIFDYMRVVQCADVPTWNIMINACGWRGEANEALKLFDQFIAEGNRPDNITMAALLNACSHAGFVDAALEIFHSMPSKYAIEPKDVHFTNIIDALSRANRLAEAENYLEKMTTPPPAAYMAVLGGCRKFSDAERALRMIFHLNRIDPSDAAAHVLLANIYSKTGQWQEWAEVRSQISSQKLKKPPGMSWGVMNGVLYTYLTKDTRNENSKLLFRANLRDTHLLKEKYGFVPDLSCVTQKLSDEAKEEALCKHSERYILQLFHQLASPVEPITISSNLRVCGDCHEWAKLMSRLWNRRIIVRDANRQHVLENGVCSCKDYW